MLPHDPARPALALQLEDHLLRRVPASLHQSSFLAHNRGREKLSQASDNSGVRPLRRDPAYAIRGAHCGSRRAALLPGVLEQQDLFATKSTAKAIVQRRGRGAGPGRLSATASTGHPRRRLCRRARSRSPVGS
jgi:hypothetical protein